MNSIGMLAAVATLSIAMPVVAAPVVEVAFVEPARYADTVPGSRFGNERERDATLAQLRTHLQTLGAHHLKGDERLAIEVLDVDLAGDIEPWRSGTRELRVLRNVAVPRIHLRYKLVRAGTESTGEERIADLNYLQNSRCRGGETLCYEKHMLTEWFVRRLGPASARRPD